MNVLECIKLAMAVPQKESLTPLEVRIFEYLQESDLSGIQIHGKLGNKIENGKSVFMGRYDGLSVAHQNLYKKLHDLRDLNLIVEINGKYRLTELGWYFIIQKGIIDLAKFYCRDGESEKHPFFVELFLDPLFTDATMRILVKDTSIRAKLQDYLRLCIYKIHLGYMMAELIEKEQGLEKATNFLKETMMGELKRTAYYLISLITLIAGLPENENQNLPSILQKDDVFKESLSYFDEYYQRGKNRILSSALKTS